MANNEFIKKFHFNSNSILLGLPDGVLSLLEQKTKYIRYKKGQAIFVEGAYPSGIYFIEEGRVKKYKSVKDGKEQIIYICNKGELIGYSALLGDETYPDSSSALEDSLIGFIPKEYFLQILYQSPELSTRLLKNLSHEFGVLLDNIVSYTHRTVRERLALSLLILNDKFSDQQNENLPVDIILKREELASIVGIALETLVRLLKEFKGDGLIETQGRKIRVINDKKLLKLANV